MANNTHPTLDRLRGTTGLWTFAHETVEASRSGEVAAFAEELGFSALWMPEAYGREPIVSSSLLLAATSSLVVGTSIASIWARDAMAAANAARTLSAASDDRFVLGLGVSHKPMVERTRGHLYERPVAAMSAYLDALEAATMFAPEGSVRPPRLIAALGPAMLELAATKADGAMPYLVTPEHTAMARRTMGDDAFLVVEQAVALTDDEADFRARASSHLQIYTGLPNYQNNWRRLGFGEEDFIPGGSARLQDAMVVRGDEAAVAARIAEHREAGADHVCIQILGADPFGWPQEDWKRLSPKAAH